jgi:dihydropteroate synthase
MRPWELPRYEAPHQAIPLGDGWWRAPAPLANREHFLQLASDAGLREAVLLPDGSLALRPDARFVRQALALKTDRSPADPSNFEEKSWADLSFAIARIEAGIRAVEQPPGAPNWMAILNLTSDSFSDGGELQTETALLAQAERAKAQGAAWLDLGAESTRPGALAISSEQQLTRLLPALQALLPLGVPISIDTRSSLVADACLQAGASMINDVSGLSDPNMAATCAQHDAALTLMHMRGTPADMQQHCSYRHLLGEVADELAAAAAQALAAGVAAHRLLLDPGIGFAKTAEQSRQLLAQLGALRALGFGLLVSKPSSSPSAAQRNAIAARPEPRHHAFSRGSRPSGCTLAGIGTPRESLRASRPLLVLRF